MARPMVLMQEILLSILWSKQQIGVPIRTLIQQNKLNITSPTLAKLLSYMSILEQEEMKENEEAYSLIYKSLFPNWLLAHEDIQLMTQPNGWKYKGKFPFGYWEHVSETYRECDEMVDIEDLKSSAE